MPGLIFLGNCQAHALAATYNQYIAEDSSAFARGIDGRHISADDRVALADAKTLVVQVSDLSQLTPHEISNSAEVVLFPYVSGGFLWPYGTEAHIFYGTHPFGKFGLYSGETGDAFLNRLIRQDVSAKDALERYTSLNIAKSCNLERRFELCLELQEKRDRISGINTASFIKDNFKQEKLFLTRGHLAISMFQFLACAVFRRIGVAESRIKCMNREMMLPPFPRDEHPIHPQVAAYFGLSYAQKGYKFRFDFNNRTFEEYVIRYMAGSYSHQIFQGLKYFKEHHYEEAVIALEDGIKANPECSEALACLGQAYEKQGDQDAAVRVLLLACATDPTWIEPVMSIAGIFFRRNEFGNAKQWTEKALALNPYDRHALHLMSVCKARIAEKISQGSTETLAAGAIKASSNVDGRPLRIAVIGNSNSVMRASYAVALAKDTRYIVDNWSIGATPNVVLFNFLLNSDPSSYDLIIIETAVMDVIQAKAGSYPESVAEVNIRRFLTVIKQTTCAQLIFLVLPTRFALLEPGSYRIEEMYRSICIQHEIPLLNVYEMLRDFIGRFSSERVSAISASAAAVSEAFNLPRYMGYDLSWYALRNAGQKQNALGIHAFLDDAHVCAAMHTFIGKCLSDWISGLNLDKSQHSGPPFSTTVMKSEIVADQGELVFRQSSLLSRSLVRAKHGDSKVYACPKGYSAVGLLLNQTRTSAFLSIESAGGNAILDCRYPDHVSAWSAIIVPIVDRVGNGDIKISISKALAPGAPVRRFPGTVEQASGDAELGELILFRHWEESSSAHFFNGAKWGGYAEIEKTPAAQAKQADLAEALDLIGDFEATSCILSKRATRLLEEQLNELHFDDLPGCRARCLLLMGATDSALAALGRELAEDNSNLGLRSMYDALAAFLKAVASN